MIKAVALNFLFLFFILFKMGFHRVQMAILELYGDHDGLELTEFPPLPPKCQD